MPTTFGLGVRAAGMAGSLNRSQLAAQGGPREVEVSDPFIGEIKMLPFSWAPDGWALCDGSLMPIQQNAALYALLGKQFGGDGVNNFALPDFRGRTPVCKTTTAVTPSYVVGNMGGAETVTLTANHVPPHVHVVNAYTQNGTIAAPTGNDISSVVSSSSGSTTNFSCYLPSNTWSADVQLNAASVSTAGANQGHNNMQPYTVLNFSICTLGNFPMRN